MSVIMASYNVEQYIAAAVNSILQQTYTDFELIIIDDGSTDGTWEVLKRLAAQDARIRLECNPENLGVARTRNRGTEIACGELIAVMDADDISLPDRFEKQVAYLDEHREIGVLGGAIRSMTGSQNRLGLVRSYPTTPDATRWRLCFGSPLVHPASMIRRLLLVEIGGYRPEFVVAHDTDLWQRLARVTQLASLPDVILHYRRHGDNITLRKLETMKQESAVVAMSAIRAELGIGISIRDMLLLQSQDCLASEDISISSALIYRLARQMKHNHQLSASDWTFVRRDAVRRILRVLCRKSYLPSVSLALTYAVRLDPVFTARWYVSTLRKSVRL